MRNVDYLIEGFVSPRSQPRAEKLKWVAGLLEKAMFECGQKNSHMNEVVAVVIERHFIPAARAHFAECVERATQIVPEMRNQIQLLRKKHLALYSDTLNQIRQENTFHELQKRSDRLVLDCEALQRSSVQTSTTICGLYCGAFAISDRFNELCGSIASKTGAIFREAPRKGMLRVCEKLSLAPSLLNVMSPGDDAQGLEGTAGTALEDSLEDECDWKPQRVLDVVRGAIECADFTVMINTLRLIGDLDDELASTGATGGIEETICITRCKGRFRTPTSGIFTLHSLPVQCLVLLRSYASRNGCCEGGWADILINFRFEVDEHCHICEVQLVHSHLYNVRKNMGYALPPPPIFLGTTMCPPRPPLWLTNHAPHPHFLAAASTPPPYLTLPLPQCP
jgi:hypothetical protein